MPTTRRGFLKYALAAAAILGPLRMAAKATGPQMGGYTTRPWWNRSDTLGEYLIPWNHPGASTVTGAISLETAKQVFGQAQFNSERMGKMRIVIRPELWEELQIVEGPSCQS